jgi:hypothetical protein
MDSDVTEQAVTRMPMSEARGLALSLAETAEQDHHGMASWRVRGKIFATVPDEDHIRVMVDKDDIRAVVAQYPDACDEVWWGSRLACVVVDLRSAPGHLVKELLLDAWRRKASRQLLRNSNPKG